MAMISEPAICETCGGPHPRADGFMPKHPFNDGSGSTPNPFAKKPQRGAQDAAGAPMGAPVQSSMPFDPVLRQALINKGVLTPQDLVEAEQMIRAITGAMLSGLPDEHKGGVA